MDYPKEWAVDKQFRISKNLMSITEQEKDILYGMMVRKNFIEIAKGIIEDKHHPFDEITYHVSLKDDNNIHREVIFDVRNNRTGDFYSVIRIVLGNEHIGNIALGVKGAFTEKHEVEIQSINKKDIPLLQYLSGIISRINLAVGYYALSCHTNRKSHKIGSVSNKESKKPTDNDKSKIIRLRDIPTLKFSTFIEGRGSKPSHEFSVRGHIRHYKNGREVFIKPYTKCKGRGDRVPKSYSISE